MARWLDQMQEKGFDLHAYQLSVASRNEAEIQPNTRPTDEPAPAREAGQQMTSPGNIAPGEQEDTDLASPAQRSGDTPQAQKGAPENAISPQIQTPERGVEPGNNDRISAKEAQQDAGIRNISPVPEKMSPESEKLPVEEAERQTSMLERGVEPENNHSMPSNELQGDVGPRNLSPGPENATPDQETSPVEVALPPKEESELNPAASDMPVSGINLSADGSATPSAPVSLSPAPEVLPAVAEPNPGDATRSTGVVKTQHPALPDPEVMTALHQAVSQLSDGRTRFTFGELMLTAAELSERLPEMDAIRVAIDTALQDGMIIPLDSEKGVFTSRIHLLDELSIQALSKEHLASTTVVSFTRPPQYAQPSLSAVEQDSVVLMNAPAGVAGIRDLTAQVVELSVAHGREVQVLASSVERSQSLAKSATLRERLISRQHVLSGDFQLKPQSTLIIEGAERLGLKETLVLLGEARARDAQLVFLDSAGRQANGNAMAVLESAGVTRTRRTEPVPGLEAQVVSIPDKRERYAALANRFAELSGGELPVTAVVVGQREQKQLTGLIRDALQNAGQLERDGVTVESRIPVYLDNKTRRMPGSYRAGMVLEDRRDAKERHTFIIDRVHEETRVISLVDGDGVLSRMKLSEVTADWRLFKREMLDVSVGDQLTAVAANREQGLKAKDRLTVTDISDNGITVQRGNKTLTLAASQPQYVTHGYVAAPGGRDNDQGVVLAALNSRDITAQTLNSLAQSGERAEIFTAEVKDKAEARLQRMKTNASPVQLVRTLAGKDDISDAVGHLRDQVKTEAGLAVWRAINDQRDVAFSELKLVAAAEKYGSTQEDIGAELNDMVRLGELLRVAVGGEPRLVARATWEMEKAILRVIDEGKNTQIPLLDKVPEAIFSGLTKGQQSATRLVLGSTDQFVGLQGYAGVGKTTQLKAVTAALETLPVDVRPEVAGLAPTHQAVKEMRDVGVEAQTIKSFIVEHDQAIAAGEKPDYRGKLFLIDESSMAGNQDTAALFQAIAQGGGRAVSMGDVDQFESVDVGAPFRLMQTRSPMDVVIMKEIVRQKNMQLRGAVYDIIDNRIDSALQRISVQQQNLVAREKGAVGPESAFQETDSPVRAIVQDWSGRTPEVQRNTLIITQLNADRHAVNEGIRESLLTRGALGNKAITIPVLDKISHTRHEFNQIGAWQTGMVVKRGDRYQDVLAVDRNGTTVTVRDEEGKIGLYSPKELITGDVQLFQRREREVREGDLLRYTATDREHGQMANQRFTVKSVNDNGDIVLQSASGNTTINPKTTRVQQHVDYAWAVTGYGAQGTSSDYVIALEGTEGGRKALATRRAFYISASRSKEHVQIYTDGKDDWAKAVKSPDTGIKTAHDALKPETQRQQAKAIWAMGQPLTKSALGRAWVRHQNMGQSTLTARVIPATRRFPEPALALPVYDHNGKSAGLALVSLAAGQEGRLATGNTRLVVTPDSQGAVLQRSQSGSTHVVMSLQAALDTAKAHPKDGVVWQTGSVSPSVHMMKVSGGLREAEAEVPAPATLLEQENQRQQALLHRITQSERQNEADKANESGTTLTLPEDKLIHIPADDLRTQAQTPYIPDEKLLARIAESESPTDKDESAAGRVPREAALPDGRLSEQQRPAELSRTLRDAERESARLPAPGDSARGREQMQDEIQHTRQIQKER